MIPATRSPNFDWCRAFCIVRDDNNNCDTENSIHNIKVSVELYTPSTPIVISKNVSRVTVFLHGERPYVAAESDIHR